MSKIKEFLQKYIGPIFKNVDWANIETGTYVRYILAIVACVNCVLNALGMNPLNLDESTLYDVVSNVLTVAILLVNTYKNNSTSATAIEYDKLMRAAKAALKAGVEQYVEDLTEELNESESDTEEVAVEEDAKEEASENESQE